MISKSFLQQFNHPIFKQQNALLFLHFLMHCDYGIGYIVERRQKESARWMRVERKVITDTKVRISNLKTDTEQEFRVYAENKAGVGPVSESTGLVLLRDPVYEPDAPGKHYYYVEGSRS